MQKIPKMNRRSKLGKPTKEFIIKRQGFWRHIGSRKETTELLSLTEKKTAPFNAEGRRLNRP
ncbi:hypothetical protein [Sutterella wadsworthensis]|uniref:hypothetical protein n=1 Tax=Sutterella wadsworthensis TaxID=40545 RepID=UPI0002FFEBC0|nr:hypothetical protein [Sutterella wadsworthensis]